jgi:predicted permease
MSAVSAIKTNSLAVGHLRARALGVVGAVVAAVTVWAVAGPVLGIQLTFRFGNGAPQTVVFGAVVGVTLVASLAGWGILAALERRMSNAREIWSTVALVVLVASLGLPLAAGTTIPSQIALGMMHLAAAGVLIPTLRRG